jgi:hypothetical protein
MALIALLALGAGLAGQAVPQAGSAPRSLELWFSDVVTSNLANAGVTITGSGGASVSNGNRLTIGLPLSTMTYRDDPQYGRVKTVRLRGRLAAANDGTGRSATISSIRADVYLENSPISISLKARVNGGAQVVLAITSVGDPLRGSLLANPPLIDLLTQIAGTNVMPADGFNVFGAITDTGVLVGPAGAPRSARAA